MTPVRARGVSALEVLVPLAIALLVAAAWFTFKSGATARYADATATPAAVREQARRALNEMADELRLARGSSIKVESTAAGTIVSFRTNSGGSVQYAAEASKSAARLVRAQDGQTVTLVDGLRSGGFSARMSGSVLTLSLSTGSEAPLQTAIAVRP